MCLTLDVCHLAGSLASSCVSTGAFLWAPACIPLCCDLLLFKVHSSCPEGLTAGIIPLLCLFPFILSWLGLIPQTSWRKGRSLPITHPSNPEKCLMPPCADQSCADQGTFGAAPVLTWSPALATSPPSPFLVTRTPSCVCRRCQCQVCVTHPHSALQSSADKFILFFFLFPSPLCCCTEVRISGL